jgi:hypothetical protein
MASRKARLFAGLFRAMTIRPAAADGASTAGVWHFKDRSLMGLNSTRSFKTKPEPKRSKRQLFALKTAYKPRSSTGKVYH